MKIKYEFSTETIEIEVDEEWADILIDLNRQEYNVNHKETRRHCSFEAYNLDGTRLPSEEDVEAEILEKEKRKELMEVIEKLTPDQRDLVRAVFFDGVSISDYARRKGVSQPAITQRKDTILKKLKNFGLAFKSEQRSALLARGRACDRLLPRRERLAHQGFSVGLLSIR